MDVAIHRFETHYRFGPGVEDERRRLDRLRAEVLDDAFRIAVERAGVGEEAELCIRNLFAPVHLNMDASDVSIRATWSGALAEEIFRVLRHGPTTNVVVYHSRRQALLDLALGVASANLGRAWAWRQLQFWHSAHMASQSEAINELMSALLREPQMLVPVLRALAKSGWLPSLSAQLGARHWETIARAALIEAGVAHLLDGPVDAPVSRTLQDVTQPSPAIRGAERVLTNTRVLSGIISGLVGDSRRETRRAVAALAIMDAEPILLRSNWAQSIIDIVADAITPPRNLKDSAVLDSQASAGARPAETDPRRAAPGTGAHLTEATHSVDGDLGPRSSANATDPQIGNKKARAASRTARKVELAPARKAAPTLARTSKSNVVRSDFAGEQTENNGEPADRRQRAFTRFAGLLFLLAIFEDLNLPDQIMANAALCARSFTWTLHQLALVLAPVEPRDPAALAFAGLSPDDESPSQDEPLPVKAEADALRECADQIEKRLELLLEYDELTQSSLLEFVTKRRGEIVADPGWIEVRLSLDDVTTEIRRAGLDLNPGYVPWLGVVVMFVYE